MRARWMVATLSALALALLTLPVPLPLFDHVDAGIEASGSQACPANAKPANLNGPRCSAVCPSIATIARAGITRARNRGEKRAFTCAWVSLAAPPLSWASAQVTCFPTGVAGIAADVAKPSV